MSEAESDIKGSLSVSAISVTIIPNVNKTKLDEEVIEIERVAQALTLQVRDESNLMMIHVLIGSIE